MANTTDLNRHHCVPVFHCAQACTLDRGYWPKVDVSVCKFSTTFRITGTLHVWTRSPRQIA